MTRTLIGAVALALLAGGAAAQQPAPGRPTVPQICTTCHKPAAGELRGVFENVAFKSKSIQLKIDAVTEIVRFDEATIKVMDAGVLKPGSALRDIPKGKEARIAFVEKGDMKEAVAISFKGPVELAPEKLATYRDVEKLVRLGPERGNYTLIDSRPLPRFQDGTIPTAINLPYPQFDKLLDRLPQDKSRLVVFFCQGVTCMMSPNSLRRAEALGYTNVKVYREGMPEWAQYNPGVTTASGLKAAWIDKDIPHVLLDVRPAAVVAQQGTIPGAISLPATSVRTALKTLPDAKLKAPIYVYDGGDNADARGAAWLIHDAGQPNVNVVAGGFQAWKAAGYKVATTPPATKIAYAPKPRPGQITIAEFTKLATEAPGSVLILDVRNADETRAGVIKGALVIPDEELLERLAELPKNVRIVAHCSTGVRAEMAYHKLKEKGYDVAFVMGDMTIDRNGKFKIVG